MTNDKPPCVLPNGRPDYFVYIGQHLCPHLDGRCFYRRSLSEPLMVNRERNNVTIYYCTHDKMVGR